LPGDYIFALNEAAGTVIRGGFFSLQQVGTFSDSLPTWNSGNFGGPALKFTGAGRIDCGTGFANFQTSSPFSLLAWFCPTVNAQNGNVIAKWNTSISGGWQWQLSANVMYLQFTDSGGSNIIGAHSNTAISINVWHQVVVTYDGSGSSSGMMFYLDGVQDTQSASNVGGSPGSLADSSLNIGARLSSGSGSTYFQGIIDHVIIHTGQWTAKDIALLYAEPFAMFAQPLPRRLFFGQGALTPVAVFRQRKRKSARPAAKRRRRASAFLCTPKFPTRLARGQRRRRSYAAAFRRKRRQVPTERLLVHGVPPELMKHKRKGQKPQRRRPRRGYLAPAPRGGCPTVTVIEAVTATARTIEAFTATALTIERLSARATVYETMNATALAMEAFAGTARIVPCVKG
jgi:hypothetical protein